MATLHNESKWTAVKEHKPITAMAQRKKGIQNEGQEKTIKQRLEATGLHLFLSIPSLPTTVF
ncbi:hypothetical protein HPP92_010910 [Vanilla planifolia]|uniref:Uncharacterized protein n=1 Tax=Vanilla planifolia TaxID=51239 RepID=A0A835QZS5_VANPL|nr:hypothetical protein HPP92_010910 [Vanilla planifolia]